MKKSLLLASFSLLLLSSAGAQSFDWAAAMGGTDSEMARAICTDAAGNVYVTGNFAGTADFDPGPGTVNLTATGLSDIFVTKLDANGALLWARAMTGTDVSRGLGIDVDAAGNVYSTGFFTSTVDFDPGPATLNLSSGSAVWRDYYVQKLNANGNLVWAHSFGSANEDIGYAIDVDVNGDIVLTGTYEGTMDADPGPGVFNLTMTSIGEIFVHKLDDAGNFVWAKSIQTSNTLQGGDDSGYAVATDATGNVIVGGMFAGEVDFDPGAGTAVLTNPAFDGFVLKLDVNGNFVWVRQLGVDGNISVNSVICTASGGVVASGTFQDEIDSDTGPGTNIVTSAGDHDIFVVKWDAAGNQQWFNNVGGPLGDYNYALAEDGSGNLYVGGFFSDTTDFDPGAGVSLGSSAGSIDVYVQQLDANGNFLSLMHLGSADNQGCFALTFGGSSLWIAGYIEGTTDMDPFAGTSNLTSAGNTDAFVVKLGSFVTHAEPESAATMLTAFPNPTSGLLTLRAGTAIQGVKILDATGRACVSVANAAQSEMVLNLDDLAAGVYLLQVQLADGVHNSRLVLE